MINGLRILLYPLSLIYGLAIWIRNKLFDKKILRSASFDFPLICVGNLAVGGTGKTPMAEYLIRVLQTRFEVATLSRGYKRKTKGFYIAGEDSNAFDIGDEPMQIHLKFPEIPVAVAEDRVIGIPQLLLEYPEVEVIILDDAFQHRPIKAGLNILLTEYSNLFTRDRLLPAGNLRDLKSSKQRAEIMIVTKCSPDLTRQEALRIIDELSPSSQQTVYFTTLQYGSPYHLFDKSTLINSPDTVAMLVCAIANPAPLQQVISKLYRKNSKMIFPDHHAYSFKDIANIKEAFEKLEGLQKIILTTEKDAVRLEQFKSELVGIPIFVWPVQHQFLFGEHEKFEKQIMDFVSAIHENTSESQ